MTYLLLQRICWNSNSWRNPTGERYKQEQSYVGRHGFGHEEWNFNTTDVIDGHVYGYSYYTPPEGSTRFNSDHDIYFLSINPLNKERFLVGVYRSAHFLTKREQLALREKLKNKGLIQQRTYELLALGLPSIKNKREAQKLLIRDFAQNIKVRPEEVEIFLPPRVLIPSDIEKRNPKRLNRYTKPVFLYKAPQGVVKELVQSTENITKDEELITDAYPRYTPAQRRIIQRSHNLLSNRFRKWLRKVGASEITVEKESVDVSCGYENRKYLFELKTCYRSTTRYVLREALGQLLEYALYPDRSRPDCLAIVIDAPPSKEDIQWFEIINKELFNIGLFWLKGETVYSPCITNWYLGQKAKR